MVGSIHIPQSPGNLFVLLLGFFCMAWGTFLMRPDVPRRQDQLLKRVAVGLVPGDTADWPWGHGAMGKWPCLHAEKPRKKDFISDEYINKRRWRWRFTSKHGAGVPEVCNRKQHIVGLKQRHGRTLRIMMLIGEIDEETSLRFHPLVGVICTGRLLYSSLYRDKLATKGPEVNASSHITISDTCTLPAPR